MLDDLRNHDATPTEEERDWMQFDPFAFLVKLAAVAVLGVMIGIYAGMIAEPDPRPSTVAETSR